MTLSDLFPDADRMSEVFVHAAAPAFFLGACVGLGSLLMGRLADVMGQLRKLAPGDDAASRAYLLHRAKLLHSALGFALAGGISTTLLLAVSFGGALLRLTHVYGAGFLFLVSTGLVGCALFRFWQEVRVGLAELQGHL